jgi:phosphoglycerate dehydrogenase-like enzyme
MSWDILITAPAIPEVGRDAVSRLERAGCQILQVPPTKTLGSGDLPELLQGMDAVIAGTERYPASVLQSAAAARLKIISRWGVGYDAIDVPVAGENGIVIAYTPGVTDEAVADYAFALLLALVRRVPEGCAGMREGRWLPRWGNDLAGKTLGIVGYGRIGHAVARRAWGFNLRLLAHDPSAGSRIPTDAQFVPLDELLAESDFVSLHASLTPQSAGLMGADQFRRMKPTACLVNTARGPLVDEAALVRALTEGWIAGAALDVFHEEPLPSEHPFRGAPNLLLSPHQASLSRETGGRVSEKAAEAILDLMNGLKPELVLNPEVFRSSKLRAPARDRD